MICLLASLNEVPLIPCAPVSDLLGRIGGEELSVFLPETDHAGALKLAETLRATVEECRPQAGDTQLTVTASIGVAVSRDAQSSMHAIQEQADEAMYRAKQAGRNEGVQNFV